MTGSSQQDIWPRAIPILPVGVIDSQNPGVRLGEVLKQLGEVGAQEVVHVREGAVPVQLEQLLLTRGFDPKPVPDRKLNTVEVGEEGS